MNAKTLYLTLLAAALMGGAQAAEAAKAVSVADSVRMQMRTASANIEADVRADVKAQARHLDVPGVEVGEIKVASNRPEAAKSAKVVFETADVGRDVDAGVRLRQDLARKALATPGFFGIYRYMTVGAVNVAIVGVL